MSAPAITNAMPQPPAMPRFIRDSLRAKIFIGVSVMLLPLILLGTGAVVGIKGIHGSFKEVVEEVIGEIEPIMSLQIALLHAAMPPNDYLVDGSPSERTEFVRLSESVERGFRQIQGGRSSLTENRASMDALIESARETWRQAQSTGERLLALPQPVGDTAAASEMKRMDRQFRHAVALLGQVHQLADVEIRREFANATATGRLLLYIVFGAFGIGFAVAVSAGAALAWSILTRVKALSEGVRAFGEENFSYRMRLEGHDELGRLASVFNHMAAELEKSHWALKEVAIRDPLTGLCNRRAFDQRLREELRRCARYRHSLHLFMLDLDHFKAINDGYGHPAGDRVLADVARIVQGAVRAADEVARYGGEEFAVILPETDTPGAIVLAERIRAAVAAYAFSADETRPFNVTVSIGLAGFPDDADSIESLVAAADKALYDAKRSGRNRVCSFALKQNVERRQ